MTYGEVFWLPHKKQTLAWRAGPTRFGVPREEWGRKGEKTVTEEIKTRQTTEEASGVESVRQATDNTGAASRNAGTESSIPGFNKYIYENLLCHVELQIESWNRKVVRDPNPEGAHALWLKAEGLGYALRLLYAFEPEFRELVALASRAAADGHSNDGPR